MALRVAGIDGDDGAADGIADEENAVRSEGEGASGLEFNFP